VYDYKCAGDAVYADDAVGADKTATGITVTLVRSGNLDKNYTLTNGENPPIVGTIKGTSIDVDVVINGGEAVEYTGSDMTLTAVVTSGSGSTMITLVEGTDYTLGNIRKSGGYGWVDVTSVSTSTYSFDTQSVRFDITEAALKAEDVSSIILTYTVGTEPSLDGLKVVVTGGQTVDGKFADLTDDQIAAIKALEAGASTTVDLTFTPSSDIYAATPVVITVKVDAKAAASTEPTDPSETNTPNPGETETPNPGETEKPTTPDDVPSADAVVDN
jgi:hypothetical protein